ncbi:unnamed protein product [Parnassius apollo]|uniref:(apollo) hypothetical protein n=1 Tax=Parnassius apollo TaxID=110799 RepID=A0A8S3YEH2_PARAO|nr:unnamed protein product [Parnassius apollo]
MSHAVRRGRSTPAQLYLDGVLESILEVKKEMDRSKISVAEVIFYCMNRYRSNVFLINGLTNESFTNEQILKMSVPLARALIARGMKEKTAMLILRNHELMAAVYYGVIFAGVIPFMIDPNCTIYELSHFMDLICPSIVFCEQNREANVTKTVNDSNNDKRNIIVVDDGTRFQQFFAGFSDNLDTFRIIGVDVNSTVIMLPTSGSTGLPKAAMLSNTGLVAQLPTLWAYHTQFPRPTNIAMLISTAQWMTHTNLMTTCPVYQITLLMTPTPTIDSVLKMIRRNKPTWALLGPAFANSLSTAAASEDLASFQTVLITGSQPGPNTMKALKEKLSKRVHLCNGYGMTETHGFISIPDQKTPFESTGMIANIFNFQFQDENGKEVGVNENGELMLRSKLCILKGYYKNVKAYKECVTDDNWLKTGDVFYQNEDGLMFFVERKKFWFKYSNYHISPEELEAVIGTVPGVQECAVCETPNGPAAGVVRRPDCNTTEQEIHSIVNSTLSDCKRLRGGVVFVTSLPHTHSGKLHRADCRHLINKLLGNQL